MRLMVLALWRFALAFTIGLLATRTFGAARGMATYAVLAVLFLAATRAERPT